ncbi:hypothetical protein GUITHDRAFT_105993 [Guillardia theta CCMP2712]|uniref:Tetratricopeptide repeat protein 38 n=1 Tax=Guillardia theta (strain CCMP2712) TaxID=905079 RepID=L1JIP6_GUITC|nr:hypothetical protein GUITHDRAFT_105993 [Guillardia theta CCMP2712]EKX48388.1 hypothetical protein GUITHDRAFT_105993 [Guillardia theta CCMP2712]|eukprot:XP_005835368.1 hypothetical protein GUITHDRAFT_105993 [Guillardia theta CCMP2712]
MPTKEREEAEEMGGREEETAAKKPRRLIEHSTDVLPLHSGNGRAQLKGRRDVQGWNSCGLTLSSCSDDAARLIDLSIEQVIGWFGDPYQTAVLSSEADPCCVVPYCIMLWLKYLGSSAGEDDPVIIETIGKAEKALSERAHSEREILLFTCLKELSEGKFEESLLLVEDYLLQYPSDAMGLKLQNDLCYFTGQNFRMRDGVARCLPDLDDETRFYGYMLGMYAFVLEEAFDYDKAQQYAQRALQKNSKDVWAIHAMAHTLEMQVDETGQYDQALSVYDMQIEFEGFQVGNRWEAVWPLVSRCYAGGLRGACDDCLEWMKHAGDHRLAFNDAHIALAVGASGNLVIQRETLAAWEKFCLDRKDDSRASLVNLRNVCIPLLRAVLAYRSCRFDDCVNELLRVRYQLYMIGGSNAQREVFFLLLIRAGLASKNKKFISLVKQLVNEKMATDTQSRMMKRLLVSV